MKGHRKEKASEWAAMNMKMQKAKCGLEAESLVNLSMLSDCSCSVCNFVKNVSFKQLFVTQSQFSKMWDFVSFFRYCPDEVFV